MKILIVEDSEVIRKGVLEMLGTFDGLVIFEAENGPKALEIFQNEIPDIVVLDLGLPYVSGFEVLRKIKNQNTPAKVIVLTNHSEKSFSDICVKYGADYFFDKSTQLDEFVSTVKIIQKEYTN